MVLRKKLALALSASAISAVALVGCSSTSSGGNVAGVPEEVLANKNARAAINMAIDKTQLTDLILNNGSTPVDYFVPTGLSYDESGKDYRDVAGNMGYAYSTDEAAKAWEKAKEEVGFDTVTLELLNYDSETSKKVGEFIQSQLQNALPGLTVEIKAQPFKQKLDLEAKGEFHLSNAGWGADYPDPLTFLATMITDSQYSNKLTYSNTGYDKLIDEAKNAPDVASSWAKYGEAEKLMLEDGFIAPLYQKGVAYAEKDYVKDVVSYSYGAPYCYKWASVEKDVSELNMTNSSDIPSMDVSKATDTVSFEVMNNTMEGLVRVDKDNKVVPGMAESWKKSEDGKTWTFTIRKDAKWSNGDPVTAKDFEYSWKRTLNPTTASEYAYVMEDIVGSMDYNTGKVDNADGVGVKAINDYTLEVQLSRPVNYFDQLMAFPIFFPQNQKVVEAQGEKYGTTSESVAYNGPFTLSTWKTEDQYIMSKNTNYWDASTVKLEKVNTKIVKDVNTAVNLYETGEIDRVGLTAEHVDNYKDKPDFKTRQEATTYFLLVNGGKINKK